MSVKPLFRLYLTTCFIAVFVLGPTYMCAYFANTSERVMRSFLEESLSPNEINGSVNESGLINPPRTRLMFSLLWGFFGAETYFGCVCAALFCLMMGRKIRPMGYIKLIPVLTLPSFALQFISKPTNCWECLLIGRLVSMFGSGVGLYAIPVFLTEVSGPSHRGPTIMTLRVCVAVMTAVASLLGHH